MMKAVLVMPNRTYWQKRFEMIEKSSVSKGLEYYETLEKEFRKAEKKIQAKIDVWYQRFANNNEISLADAKRLLNSSELEEFKWNVEDYIKHGQENAFTQEWMKELENASAKVHISRLEALKLQIQQEAEVLYGNQLDGVDKLARDIYTDTYYHSAFEIQKGFNVGWDFQRLDSRLLNKVVSKPWTADGKTFSEKLWTQKNDLISTLHTELTQAIMRGDAPDNAINTIARKFKTSKSKAGRLVMTESAYFSSVAQKDCFKELDVEKFEIVATLDSHTSELCQSMDGTVQDMKDFEPGVTAPPFHPWCRTTTVPYFDDDEGYRAARGEDGKTYYVPSNMKYGEWKEKFVDGGSVEKSEQYNSKNEPQKAYQEERSEVGENTIKTEKIVNNSSEILTNDVNDDNLLKVEMSESSKKTFKDNVNDEYKIEDIEKQLSEVLNGGTDRAKKVFQKFATKDDIETWNSQDGNGHLNGKIRFNALESIKDERGLPNAFFHEYGHKIDFEARGTNTRLSLSNNKFGELIRSDVNDYIEKFKVAKGELGYSFRISQEIGLDMSKEEASIYNAISDIFDGVTDGSVVGKYGHSNMRGYWQNPGAIETEAFAHMFQAQFDSERYALMKKYFPNALKEFENLLEGVT